MVVVIVVVVLVIIVATVVCEWSQLVHMYVCISVTPDAVVLWVYCSDIML